MSRPPMLDAARCEALALRAAADDGVAWTELLELIWPVCLHIIARSRSMGPLSRSEDHVRNVATNLAQKLGGDGARGLVLYSPWRERNPEKTFEDWIRIVAANAVRDYVRVQMGDATSAILSEPSPKRLLNELRMSPLVDQLGIRPSMTAAQTARKLLEFAAAQLSPGQFHALGHWMEGATFDEIAREMSLGEPDAARRLVRAGVAVLRREFGAADPE